MTPCPVHGNVDMCTAQDAKHAISRVPQSPLHKVSCASCRLFGADNGDNGYRVICSVHANAYPMLELLQEIRDCINKKLVIDGLTGEVEHRVVKLLAALEASK